MMILICIIINFGIIIIIIIDRAILLFYVWLNGHGSAVRTGNLDAEKQLS